MKLLPVALCAALFAGPVGLHAAAQAAPAHETRGHIDEVTVYRGQALITRLVEAPDGPGLIEIIVTDLPVHIVPGSLFAESAGGVEVRSVRFRERPVLQDVREEVRRLDGAIRDVEDALARVRHESQGLGERKVYLGKLEEFTARTATNELSQGVLDPEALKDLTAFIFEQRQSIADEEIRLQIESRDLEEQLALLRREREQVTGSSSQTAREAVISANVLAERGAMLRLRYIVSNATWSPSYAVRAAGIGGSVEVDYHASVQQLSGEPWNDVRMTLSTATPALAATAPVLMPLSVVLAQAGPADGDELRFDDAAAEIYSRREKAERDRNLQVAQSAGSAGGAGFGGGGDQDKSLNELARDLQVLELAASGWLKQPGANSASRSEGEEGVSVTYEIAQRTSIPSRSDLHLIQIASLSMPAAFHKIATPVLTSAVFDEAVIVNRGDMVLLEGPVASYVGGRFVGHGGIPTVAIGEAFHVGFGIDSSLRAARELLSREENIQGGNRIVDLTYRLSVSNFGAEAMPLRLIDRMPGTTDSGIKVSLVSTSVPLSEDAEYLKDDRKTGILRWEISVPAETNGADDTAVEYTIRLEYDKQMSITEVPGGM